MRLIMQQSPVHPSTHARRRLLRPSTAPAKEAEGLLPAQMADVNLSLGPYFLYIPPAQSADPAKRHPPVPV